MSPTLISFGLRFMHQRRATTPRLQVSDWGASSSRAGRMAALSR